MLFISDGIDENVQNGKDLFKYMIQCGSIGPCNLDHLADMLQEIHRRDLAERVRKFQSDGMLLLFLSLYSCLTLKPGAGKYCSYSVIRRTVFFKKFLISTKNYRQSLGASYRRIFSHNNFFFITVTGMISSK